MRAVSTVATRFILEYFAEALWASLRAVVEYRLGSSVAAPPSPPSGSSASRASSEGRSRSRERQERERLEHERTQQEIREGRQRTLQGSFARAAGAAA